MLKRIVVLGVALFGLTATAPALAQQYPPKDHKVDVSNMSPCPAEPFTVTAQTFAPGSTVTVQLVSTGAVLGTATADDQGKASVEVSIPDSPAAGESVRRDIAVVGHTADQEELNLTAAIEIRDCDSDGQPVPAAAAPSGDDLPRTGADNTKTLFKAGLALAALGGLLLAMARRRRHAAAFRAG